MSSLKHHGRALKSTGLCKPSFVLRICLMHFSFVIFGWTVLVIIMKSNLLHLFRGVLFIYAEFCKWYQIIFIYTSHYVFIILFYKLILNKILHQTIQLTEDKDTWLSERWSYHNFSSLQWGSSSTADSSVTPESSSLFRDRLRYLRCEGFDLRAEARAAQPPSVTPQSLNL